MNQVFPLLFLLYLCTIKLCAEAIDLTNSFQPNHAFQNSTIKQPLSFRVNKTPSVRRENNEIDKNIRKIYNSSPNVTLEIPVHKQQYDKMMMTIVAEGRNMKQSFESLKDFNIVKGSYDQDKTLVSLFFKTSMVAALKLLHYPIYIHVTTLMLLNQDQTENLILSPITVAQLIETPSIHTPRDLTISETQPEITLLTSNMIGASQVRCYFQPELIKDIDYEDMSDYPLTENRIRLQLKPGRTWRKDNTNTLYIIGIDSGAGMLSLPTIPIASFHDQTSTQHIQQPRTLLRGAFRKLRTESMLPLGIEILAMEEKVYQSHQQQRIEVYGFGLHEGMKLVLDPPLQGGIDYTIEFISDTQLNLNLLPHRTWRATPGPLFVKEIILYNQNHYLVNGKEGTIIATVIEDPHITTATPSTSPTYLPTDLPTPPPTITRQEPDITIDAFPQMIYEKALKVRIRCTGFEVIPDNEIFFTFTNDLSTTTTQSVLTKERDYQIYHDQENGGLVLKLILAQQLGETQQHKRWADITEQSIVPVPLILSAVRFSSLVVNDPNKNYLPIPLTIAHVLPTPTVLPNEQQILYQSQSLQLIIRGKGLKGSRGPVTLFFRPSLQRGVIYEDISTYPLPSDEIHLQLKPSQKWRNSPGMLYLIGIDTGGGHVHMTHHNSMTNHHTTGGGGGGGGGSAGHHTTAGLVIAEIRADVAPPEAAVPNQVPIPGTTPTTPEQSAVVNPTDSSSAASPVLLYEMIANTKTFSSYHVPRIIIHGRGFQAGMGLILDPPHFEHQDYDLQVHSENQMSLQLRPGKHWIGNTDGYLLCKAVLLGTGQYPINGEEGMKIAWIVSDPPTAWTRFWSFFGMNPTTTTTTTTQVPPPLNVAPKSRLRGNGLSLQLQILLVVTYTLGFLVVLACVAIVGYRYRHYVFYLLRVGNPTPNNNNHHSSVNTTATATVLPAASVQEQRPTSTGGDVISSRGDAVHQKKKSKYRRGRV